MQKGDEVAWNPWHGCHKCSPGCANCFVYQMDKRYGRNSSVVQKVKTNFNLPIQRDEDGDYKYPSGTHFKLCFTSDFFIEEADAWREECWDMIRRRKDCTFILTTKRANRIKDCLPKDWGDGWDNVTLSVSCENQDMADKRLPYLLGIPAKHRYVFLSPLLEYVNLCEYLPTGLLERVCVGGESYSKARLCSGRWVEQIYIDCLRHNTPFDFHQTGSRFLRGSTVYKGTLGQQWAMADIVGRAMVEKYKDTDPKTIEDVFVANEK